ncbi:MAG: ADP-ribosylation factor family protein [Candidatus Hodarchaeales archaeon]|jgi:small GTP-binding protein
MEEDFYLAWLGLAAAGKTTLIKRMIKGRFIDDLPPTIGINIDQLKYKNSASQFVSWDVGGQAYYRDDWKPYLKKSSGCVFVIDSNDREKVPEVKEEFWMRLVPEIASLNIPLVVLANKQDLTSPMSTGEIARAIELHKLEISYGIIPTSAKTGLGIEKALEWLQQIIIEMRTKERGEEIDSIYDDL